MSQRKTASSGRVQGLLFAAGALILAVPVLSAAGCAPESDLDTANEERTASPDQEALDSIQQHPHKELCSEAPEGFARCHARVRVKPDGPPTKVVP